jgi:tetratricopeptide (TPR) repeat protein
MNLMHEVIGGRYQLRGQIGAGGMGAVYRAWDRLSGQTVALKRVVLPTEDLMFASRPSDATGTALRLALAREFRTLASLRHPHIISVLDYGFARFAPDEVAAEATEAQPYFIMTYLPDARPFDQAVRRLAFPMQIELITQMLGALAYLHRHNILHRDLKPGNVLVTQPGAAQSSAAQLHLVDFGLSEGRGSSGTISGTLAYIAPEVLDAQPLSEATDLYAVGVMLYELFAGQQPFGSGLALISEIRRTPPDLAPLRAHPDLNRHPAVIALIERLLAKAPSARYDDAQLVIDDLRTAVGLPTLPESAAIRESFLQAAKFVGRDDELAMLTDALHEVIAAETPAQRLWLIGGESGVGKSRLLEELRARALVAGALVLRGQAVMGAAGESGGGLPYQLWRDIARRLALAFARPDDAPLPPDALRDLGALRALVPDIDELVGQDIPLLPPLADAKSAYIRLAVALASGLRRLGSPVLLILEDIQWTGESLDVLKALIPMLTPLPALLVASYRADERPDLAAQLPNARLLPLARLDAEAISALSAAMLGAVGTSSGLIELLQRETEGNAFFLVETVRVLAEERGRLRDIGRGDLPERVFAGGVAAVIQRRLSRAPAEARPMLKAAAVAGRQLDLAVLGRMTDAPERLLPGCAAVAVLEVSDGGWRFAHDKLREALLDDLDAAERAGLHRTVAQALEHVYPDSADRAAELAGHWGAAGDRDKERHYALQAGVLAYDLGQFHASGRFLARALALTPDDTLDQVEALWHLSNSLVYLNDLEAAQTHAEHAMGILDVLERQTPGSLSIWRVRLGYRLNHILQNRGSYEEAGRILRAVLPLVDQVDDVQTRAAFLNRLGTQYVYERSFEAALDVLHQGLALARSYGSRVDEMLLLNNLTLAYYHFGKLEKVLELSEQAIEYCRSVNDRHYLSDTLGNRGVLLWSMGRYAEAVDFLLEALAIDQQMGKHSSELGVLITLGYCYAGMGSDDLALVTLRLALRQALDGTRLPLALDALSGIASLWAKQGRHERAAEVYGLALSHPATDVDIELTIKHLIDDLRPQLDESALNAALERGKALDFDAQVAEALADSKTDG